MTTFGFDEHDDSYIDDAYDDFTPAAIYRCIKAESKWDPQLDLTAAFDVLADFEKQINALCIVVPDSHERLDKLLDTFYRHGYLALRV